MFTHSTGREITRRRRSTFPDYGAVRESGLRVFSRVRETCLVKPDGAKPMQMPMPKQKAELQRTLIFDGDCGFCTSCANWVATHSSTTITVVPWQLTDVTAFGLTNQETSRRVYLVVGDKHYSGHRAFARILIAQRNLLLRAVGWMLDVPPVSWAGALGYLLVARFRHKLPGGTPACAVARDASGLMSTTSDTGKA